MTGRTIRWHHYSDHRGRTISVKAVQNASGDWEEFWETHQLMAVDLSSRDEDDCQEQPSVVYRSASSGSRGPQYRGTISNLPKSHNRKDRR